MRLNRIVVAVVAFALLGLTPLLGGASASAGIARSLSSPPAATPTEVLPRRELHDTVVNAARQRLILKGRVDPGHGPVFIERKLCEKGCVWKLVDQVSTDQDRRWRVQIFAPKNGEWFYRGYVKAYGGYAKSKTTVWRTYSG